MSCEDRYFVNQRGQADHRLRCEQSAAANGDDREAALAALGSLRRVYRLRLPLVEARLGLNDNSMDSRFRGNDEKEAA